MRPKLLLVLTLILLAACGGQPTADGQASQTQVEVTRLVEVEVTRLVETEVEVTRLVETVVTPAPAPTSPRKRKRPGDLYHPAVRRKTERTENQNQYSTTVRFWNILMDWNF